MVSFASSSSINFDETPEVTWEAYEYEKMPLPEEVTLER